MSNDWTNKLRDCLADYQEPVKDDLWAAIEQSVAQNSVSALEKQQKKSAKVMSVRRLSMAAAIAALAIGGTYVYLNPWDEKVDSAQLASVMKTGTSLRGKATKEAELQSDQANLPFAGKPKHPVAEDINPMAAPLVALEEDVPQVTSATEENQEPSHEPSQASYQEPFQASFHEPSQASSVHVSQNEDRNPSNSQLYPFASGQEEKVVVKKEHKRGLTLNVYCENKVGMANGSGGGDVFVSSDMASSSPTYAGDNMILMGSGGKLENGYLAIPEYHHEVKHHQPISVGAQVGIGLSSRLTLTTGLVYTFVSSDFINYVNGSRMEVTQRLHYLGIPLNLNCSLWNTRRFHTYILVGGEGAVNVKSDTKRDRMQWSANTAFGAQYDVMPELGIYVEPGLKYYFDNGSQIENIFKDKNLNFSMQLGLRWNLGK